MTYYPVAAYCIFVGFAASLPNGERNPLVHVRNLLVHVSSYQILPQMYPAHCLLLSGTLPYVYDVIYDVFPSVGS